MKFRLKCKEKSKEGVDREMSWEEYDREDFTNIEQAKDWAKATVMYFNSTLRNGEQPRELVAVEEVKELKSPVKGIMISNDLENPIEDLSKPKIMTGLFDSDELIEPFDPNIGIGIECWDKEHKVKVITIRREKGPRKVRGKVTSWVGTMAIGAQHYYARLEVWGPDVRVLEVTDPECSEKVGQEFNTNWVSWDHKETDDIKVEIRHKLTKDMPHFMMTMSAEESMEHKGKWTNCFDTPRQARRKMIEIYKKFFGDERGWKLEVEK